MAKEEEEQTMHKGIRVLTIRHGEKGNGPFADLISLRGIAHVRSVTARMLQRAGIIEGPVLAAYSSLVRTRETLQVMYDTANKPESGVKLEWIFSAEAANNLGNDAFFHFLMEAGYGIHAKRMSPVVALMACGESISDKAFHMVRRIGMGIYEHAITLGIDQIILVGHSPLIELMYEISGGEPGIRRLAEMEGVVLELDETGFKAVEVIRHN